MEWLNDELCMFSIALLKLLSFGLRSTLNTIFTSVVCLHSMSSWCDFYIVQCQCRIQIPAEIRKIKWWKWTMKKYGILYCEVVPKYNKKSFAFGNMKWLIWQWKQYFKIYFISQITQYTCSHSSGLSSYIFTFKAIEQWALIFVCYGTFNHIKLPHRYIK